MTRSRSLQGALLLALFPLSFSGQSRGAAAVEGSEIRLVDEWGRDRDSYVPGERIFLQVRSDVETPVPGQTAVEIETGSDRQVFPLLETGDGTGVYTGWIVTHEGTGSHYDGRLGLLPGDVVTAIHLESGVPGEPRDEAAGVAARIGLVDDGGRPVDVCLEGDRIQVRLWTLDGDPSTVDASWVQVSAGLSGDQEELLLRETGPETGILAGALPTRRGEAAHADGVLQLGRLAGSPPQLDSVTVTEGASGASATAAFAGSRTRLLDAWGGDAQVYATGSAVHVRVEDHEADDPASQDTVSVSLRSFSTGDEEMAVLTEAAHRGGIFEGSLPLADSATAAPFNGELEARPGEEIEARRTDGFGVASWDRAAVAAASIEIVDEDGRPTDEVLEDGPLRVRVFSLAGAVNPLSPDTLTVLLRSRFAEDEESLILTETEPDSRVFEGSLSLGAPPAAAGNGTLETDGSRERDEEVTAFYGAVSDTARAVLLRLWITDWAGRSTATLPLGEPVRIRVERRRGSGPGSYEHINVDIGVLWGGDRESIWLEETGRDTGVFEGTIPSTEGDGPPHDGVLQGRAGRALEAAINSWEGPRFIRQAVLAWSSIEFVDRQGRPALFCLESSRAYLRVVDHFADPDPWSAGAVQVRVTAHFTGDAETVALAETGRATGIFEGSVPLRLAPSSAGNGFLETAESPGPPHFDLMAAEHVHPSGVSRDEADLRGSLTWWTDAQGRPTASYATGSTAYVRVEDHNADRLGTVRERVEVTLRSLMTGDEETLEILETGRATGVFEGAVPLRDHGGPTPGDGHLDAGVGEEIEAEHPDLLGYTASRATAAVAEASLSFVDADGVPTAELVAGNTALLRVFAFERNVDPASAESVTVAVRGRNSADEETATLTETGPDTSTFEGGIALRQGEAASGNGVLEVRPALYSYDPEEQATVTFASLTATARVASRRIVFIDAWGREAESYALGGRIHLRVIEPSANGLPSYPDTIDVGVYVPGGDQEGILLEETHRDSGVFEGSIGSAPGAASSNDEVLQGAPGDVIEAFRYTPPVARARLTASAVAFVDSAGRAAPFYFESTRAYVQVATGLVDDPSQVDTVTAEVSTEGSQDRETLLLTETGADTGIFQGSIPLRTGSAWSHDGELQTAASPQEPDSLVATHGSASARIDLRRSRTAFLDEWGQEAGSYPTGATVRVRVEDHNASPVRVVLRSLSTADEEVLEPGEAGEALFEGALPLAHSGSPAPGDGLLQALPGEEITATHEEPLGLAASGARARVVGEALAFVDEAGAPAPHLLERGTARLRAVSLLDNVDPAAAESVTATVRSLYGSDLETVTLAETGPDTGVFTAIFPLGLSSAVHGDGVLATGRGGPSGGEWDRLTATFRGTQAVAETRRSRLAWIDAFGADAESFAVGETAHVRMTMPSADGRPDWPDFVTVYVGSLASQVYEYIELEETGPSTGVFEGSVGTADEGEPDALGVVPIAVGATFSVRHAAHPDVDVSSDEAAMAANSVRLLDSQGRPSPSFPRGFRVAVRLVDVYADADEGSPGSAEVTLVSDLTGDEETLLLTETGAATGVFEGTILLRPGLAQPGDGTVDTGEQPGPPQVNDTIRATRSAARGTSTVSATVADHPPLAADDSAETAEDTAVGIPVLANDDDPEGSLLQVAEVTQGANGAVAVQADQTVIYAPQPDFHGTDNFSYTVSDGQGGSATATVSVVVTPVNDPPAAVDDSVEIDEDSTAIVPILANDLDADGGNLTVSSVTQGTHGEVTILENGREVRYQPVPDFYGDDSFTYTVSDGQGGSATATVSVTVTPINDPPAALGESVQMPEDTAATVAVLSNDTDVDGDALVIAGVTQGARGTVTAQGDLVTVHYQPASDFYGDDSFTYTVSDGQGGSATAMVSVTVTPVNDPPAALGESVQMAEDTAAIVAVLSNDTDVDGDTLVVAGVTQGAHGTVTLQGDLATLLYRPAPDFHGSDGFTYTVSDGQGGSATATVSVTVTPVNDPPVARDDSAVTVENQSVDIYVLANDSDVDGLVLEILSTTAPAHGTVAFTSDRGFVRYTPHSGYAGSDSFEYTVRDGAGGEDTAVVRVTVRVPRVWSGIQALYDFEEGGGATVRDRSGVGAPLDLTVADPSAVHWGSGSLVLDAPTIVQSGAAAAKVTDACVASDALTLEAWVTPADLAQSGRWILTLSGGEAERNFTLGQGTGLTNGDLFEGRVRAALTTQNGLPSLSSSEDAARGVLVHVVYTRTSGGTARIYVDDQMRGELVVGGAFDGWSSAYRLALGAEIGGGRAWLGELHLIAVYCRALTALEVRQNFRAGPSGY